mmetsp:Transcript_6781/g.9873  ORF Transcript_6781/g.9873 Transcript_6781/m.9873 type:complete len:320 (-) Transcript_6781:470-1429(-)|eukprot:CAMPEP_0172425754 /NCGR_PEP_ID=MMETSP1064-20121228/33859_1 /TAXON_ID=202472 /ORGANISM="Aulacoseira subarctica , Strain CCAP 1002/5" /LENGTH=319 /DNA_ID=CAMNT_0013168913 /DNA_START=181 /DNA_END=1140 /DNA_ORIENTATION=+
MTEKTKSKQRIAALEAKLESTHAAMKDVLLSAWDEIDDLKQQNVSMKTQITELESALNLRFLVLNQRNKSASSTGVPLNCKASTPQGNVTEEEGSSTALENPSHRENKQRLKMPRRATIAVASSDQGSHGFSTPRLIKRFTIPLQEMGFSKANNETDAPMKRNFRKSAQPSIQSCPESSIRSNLSERVTIPLIVQASRAANHLRKTFDSTRRDKAMTSQEMDLRRVFDSMDMTCAITMHDLQSKLQGKEAAIATLQKTRLIQDVTIASLDLEVVEQELTNLSLEECREKLKFLQMRGDELDRKISRLQNNDETLKDNNR